MSSPSLDAVDATEPRELVEQGEALLTARDVAGAIAVLDRAEAAGAEADRCAGARWHCWMLLGNFENAWKESDAIRARGRRDPQSFWDGSDPTGKRVMVRSLHGYGDAVQNLRFLPALRRRASRVMLEVAPPLLELARCFAGADEVMTWGEQAPAAAPAYDMQVEITELPYLLRCGASDVAATVPYCRMPDAERDRHRQAMPARTRPRVGLAWASSLWDPSRTIPFRGLASLLRSSAVEFWSLQTAADNRPWRQLCDERRWPARVAGEGSAVTTALFVTDMDLVITVDTFVAHLAGALGRPVWLLLKQDADWRWGIERNDTPWYSRMELFRQREKGNWAPVLAEVEELLERWSASQE